MKFSVDEKAVPSQDKIAKKVAIGRTTGKYNLACAGLTEAYPSSFKLHSCQNSQKSLALAANSRLGCRFRISFTVAKQSPEWRFGRSACESELFYWTELSASPRLKIAGDTAGDAC